MQDAISLANIEWFSVSLYTHAIEQSFIKLSLLPSMRPHEIVCLANYTGYQQEYSSFGNPGAGKAADGEGENEDLELRCHVRQLHAGCQPGGWIEKHVGAKE